MKTEILRHYPDLLTTICIRAYSPKWMNWSFYFSTCFQNVLSFSSVHYQSAQKTFSSFDVNGLNFQFVLALIALGFNIDSLSNKNMASDRHGGWLEEVGYDKWFHLPPSGEMNWAQYR